MQVLGYVRVSTSEQASSGAGLEAQRRAILAECERRGWHLVETIEDAGYSARHLRRPGIQEALSVRIAICLRPLPSPAQVPAGRARGNMTRKAEATRFRAERAE